jgi:hypothetical protein
MKSKKIEIEIASPDLDDKMIEELVKLIKSSIQEKHITDNFAFDIEVKDNNNHQDFPVFPSYPYKEIDNEKLRRYKDDDKYPLFPNKIMCGTEKVSLNTDTKGIIK